MRIDYGATGKERKALVEAIEKITGEKAIYKFVPTCAYEIGSITVDKTGGVNSEDEEKLKGLVESLREEGFTPMEAEEPESQETEPDASAAPSTEDNEPGAQDIAETGIEEPESMEETTAGQEASSESDQPDGLTITLPLDKVAVGTLDNILHAKGSLIKKALGINELPYEIDEDRISFPWFSTIPDPDAVRAYTDFIAKLCALSKELKRASATEVPAKNEKYAFRCFLLRLGFIGADFKAERKILLHNLSGNSSWKNGAPKKEETVCE